MAAKTVLIVDDDKDIVVLLETMLRGKGYRVVTADDGNMGLALAEREAPNLVLVDMMMPKKSGLLVLEKLKSRPGAPPVIMMTANDGMRHQAYAESLGVDAYLRKPFEFRELFDLVARLCPCEPEPASGAT